MSFLVNYSLILRDGYIVSFFQKSLRKKFLKLIEIFCPKIVLRPIFRTAKCWCFGRFLEGLSFVVRLVLPNRTSAVFNNPKVREKV